MKARYHLNLPRVILQDFTGVPAVVDLASLRKAMDDVGEILLKLIQKYRWI